MPAIKLSNVRLSHSNLYEPREFKQGDGRPRRSANFIVVKGSPNDKIIEAAIIEAAKDAFNGDATKANKWIAGVRGQKTQDCYRPYVGEGDDDDTPMMNLSTHRAAKQGPVGVYDNIEDPEQPGSGKVRPIPANEGRPYDGCYVNAVAEIYVQTTGENQGIRGGLSSVQFYKDGDAFSGAKAPTGDDFEPIAGGADADPLA